MSYCVTAWYVDKLSVSAWTVNASGSYVEGQTAVLVCQSSSHGDVQLAWMKDGRQLGHDGDGEGSSTLTLSELTSRDSGQYVCVATRHHESITSTPISISVTEHTRTFFVLRTMFRAVSRSSPVSKSETSLHRYAGMLVVFLAISPIDILSLSVVCHVRALCSNGRRYPSEFFCIRQPHVSPRSR